MWDPETDPSLPAPFSAGAPAGRAASKAALQARFRLAPSRSALVFGVVSRLSHQKGLDLLLACLPDLLAQDAQLALLGSGDADLEAAFRRRRGRQPGPHRRGVRL